MDDAVMDASKKALHPTPSESLRSFSRLRSLVFLLTMENLKVTHHRHHSVNQASKFVIITISNPKKHKKETTHTRTVRFTR